MNKHMTAQLIRPTLSISVKVRIVPYNPSFSQLIVKGQVSVTYVQISKVS